MHFARKRLTRDETRERIMIKADELFRQFGFGTVVVGESKTFQGGIDWLRSLGVTVIDLDSDECFSMLQKYISEHPAVWNEDIGQE